MFFIKDKVVSGADCFAMVVSLDSMKRLLLTVAQVTLDMAIYWICLESARVFWVSAEVPPLWVEREIFFCGVFLICFCFRSLYAFRTWMFWDETREALKASTTAVLVIVTYLFALKLQFSRLLVVAGTALFVPTCLFTRYCARRLAVRLGLLRTAVLVIGAGKAGKLYAQKVARHPFMGCQIVGFLDDDPRKLNYRVTGIPVLGRLEDFEEATRGLDVDEVIVAIPTAGRDLLARILNIVEMRVKRVSYIPDMYMLTTFSAIMRDIDGLPMISATQGLLSPINRLLKSVMDYCGAVVALLLFSPLFLYVAWKIKKDDGGEVLFEHNRVGQDLTPFKMRKFRTMVPDAEKILEELLKDEERKKEFELAFKFKEDPRVTKVGYFLRKTSLDELPQLFNVLKGEMSLVGPRPIVKKEVELYYGERTARQIFNVKPGLTGFWQVSGRNDVQDYQQRIDLDLYYIRNWSPWLDIVILFRTMQVLLNANGAY
ncbi:MAG: sugar transferase [Synergistaceae bacterium]|jgi:undecaprenyl-phosphate galactose phosphotransferase|nr:sugar transferase [Synergistaceae bacterium]